MGIPRRRPGAWCLLKSELRLHGLGCCLCGCFGYWMSRLHTLKAMTGCECLSGIIRAISLRKASGSSTSAWTSASGLPSTMAMSISPPSFLIRAAILHFVQNCHSLILTDVPFPLFDCPLCRRSRLWWCYVDPGVPNALRNASVSGSAGGRLAAANAAWRRSLALASYACHLPCDVRFRVRPHSAQGEACFEFHIPFVLH